MKIKFEISKRSILDFVGKIWNYFPNQQRKQLEEQKEIERKKLFDDIYKWYVVNVTGVREMNIKEKHVERINKLDLQITHFCSECKSIFYDYPSLVQDRGNPMPKSICDKCIYGGNVVHDKYSKKIKVPVNPYNQIVETPEGKFRIRKVYEGDKLVREIKTPVEPNKFDGENQFKDVS